MDSLNIQLEHDICSFKFSVSHSLSFKVGGLVHSRHDEGRNSLGCLACSSFQPTNARDEPIMNPYRDLTGLTICSMLTKSSTVLTVELNLDIDDLTLRGFWERRTDCIIDVRTCDVN